jgi:hypothetical protein
MGMLTSVSSTDGSASRPEVRECIFNRQYIEPFSSSTWKGSEINGEPTRTRS